MRVLHVESGPNWGGQEVRNATEVQWLNAHGHTAWLACDPGSESFRRAPEFGIDPIALPMSRPGYGWSVWRLLRLCRKLRVDIIQTHSPLDSWIAAPLHRLGWPVVRSRNILNAVPPNQRAWIYRHGCRRIIATAECIKRALVEHTGVPASKIDVVGEGVDTTKFRVDADGAAFRREVHVPASTPLIGMISMLRGEKGGLDFVKVALKVLQEMPGVRFVIAGDGPQRVKIETAIVEGVARLAKNSSVALDAASPPILLAGYRRDTPEVLAALDLVVIPSHIEARCRVLSEAMFLGRPVVANRVGGMVEVLEDGQTGLLVPPREPQAMADAVMRLLREPETRRRMGARGREKANAEMTLELVMAQTLAVYQAALADG